MSVPTPLRSLYGGLALSLPIHSLLMLNGNVFGISGFLRRAVRGNPEAVCSVAGLIAGGMIVGIMERKGPAILSIGLPHIIVSGLLVGLGTGMSNGCTSGHMICGISRFSRRSIVATCTFGLTGAITSRVMHADFPSSNTADWSLDGLGNILMALQIIPLIIEVITPFLVTKQEPQSQKFWRRLICFTTGLHFSLALRLSNLTDPVKVISFLLLPFHRAFDPSLIFLAIGALPLTTILYQFFRGDEKSVVDGSWKVSKGGQIDLKLVVGAALFGIGWGIVGICPGPGLVNFGHAVVSGSGIVPLFTWLASVAIGGLLV